MADKTAAASRRAIDFQAGILTHEHVLDDGQALTRTTDFARPRFLHAAKALRDPLQLMRLDADSRIGHIKPRIGVFRLPRDLDSAPLGRVSNGIEYEIQKGGVKLVVSPQQSVLGFHRVSRTAASFSTSNIILTIPRLVDLVSLDPDLKR